MGVFYRRPLALFSFLFLIFALLSYNAPEELIILGIIITLSVILILALSAFAFKRIKVKLLVASVCISAILFSLLQTILFIAIPVKNADKYEGENVVLCYVIDEVDGGKYSKSYSVKIKRVGDDTVDIRALLTCGFDPKLRGGDEIYGAAEIIAKRGDEPSQLLTVYMEDAQNSYVKHNSDGKGDFETLFSECGIEIMSSRLSERIKSTLYSILGETKGSLAMGFFTGDRSDIPTDVTRDFRRAGASHLMAVSGSHIAILLGAIELILKKLQVHKNARCAVITCFSIGFLFITGFSLSALRSVFMLYAVYLSYFLRESGDSITALFASIMIIVFVFPHSIVDIGLWMSFAATLGLLTAYPIIEEKIPYPRKKPKAVLFILKAGRELLLIALMTVVANMYLLPIIWYYFKEFSLVSVLSNVIITYPSSLFLLSVPILLMVHRIPIVGFMAKGIVAALADIIIFTVRLCSGLPNATVSLKYEFCSYIVLIFTVGMCVLLAVRLKKKLFALLPAGFAVTAFCVCFFVYGVFLSTPTVTYLNQGKNEIFALNDNTQLSIYDGTSGGLSAYYYVKDILNDSYATEIDNYIYTEYNGGSALTFEKLAKSAVINNVYLPVPEGDDEMIYAQNIYEIAKENGIDTTIYNNGVIIKNTNTVTSQVYTLKNGEEGKHVTLYCDGKVLAYATPQLCQTDIDYSILIVGERKVRDEKYDLCGVKAKKIYIASERLSRSLVLPDSTEAYIPDGREINYKIKLRFE